MEILWLIQIEHLKGRPASPNKKNFNVSVRSNFLFEKEYGRFIQLKFTKTGFALFCGLILAIAQKFVSRKFYQRTSKEFFFLAQTVFLFIYSARINNFADCKQDKVRIIMKWCEIGACNG